MNTPLGYLPEDSIKFLNLLCVLLFKVLKNTPYKKSSVKDFLSKCKQICRKTRDLFTFTKYMLNENLFCVVIRENIFCVVMRDTT